MTKWIQTAGCVAILTLSFVELSGCGSPPPPRSAKAQIESAEDAIDTGNSQVRYKKYDLAVIQYEKALDEIRSAEGWAIGNEATRLGVLKDEARSKKVAAELNARTKSSESNAREKAPATVAVVDQDAVKRKAEQVKEAEVAASNKAALDAALAPKVRKSAEEPEDDGAATKAKGAKVAAGTAAAAAPGEPGEAGEAPAAAVKLPPKDKNGIFANADDKTPPLIIAKITRIGKFVLAYCQYRNTSPDSKRIAIYNYFKDHDNQLMVPQLTTAAFAYEHFSVKVKDLIGDQSVHNYAPNATEVGPGEVVQFVSVGECEKEEFAKRVTKVYVDIHFDGGGNVDLTSAETASMPELKINLPGATNPKAK